MFLTQIHALSPEQIAQGKALLEENPSILQSGQVQELMQQNKKTTAESPSKIKDVLVENNIDIPEYDHNYTNPIKSNTNKISSKKTSLRLNPLAYQTNDEKLWQIKTDQSFPSRARLERFSKLFFRNKNKINPNQYAVSPSYIINKGDIISFWIYGTTNKKHELEVDRRGNINIPDVGPVHVAGEKFQEVKELLTNYLSSSYQNSQVVVDINSFSTIQVTVTGYVNAPGIYNTTSVSSIKDILMEANGVSDIGSVRNIKVIRHDKVIDTIDYYHLLTQGREQGDTVLQAGDIIHIPKAYGLISIDGEVNQAAIYEIEPRETLAHILQYAGGLKAAANGRNIYVKRFNNHSNVEYKTLTLLQAKHFIVKDGDEVYIGKLHKTDERYIELIGNIIDPGKKHIGSKSLKLSTFLKTQLKGKGLDSFFLPNTNFKYAMIKRLDKYLKEQVYHINLIDIINHRSDFSLHNKDKLYIFNNLDTSVNPYVIIKQARTEDEINNESNNSESNVSCDINRTKSLLSDMSYQKSNENPLSAQNRLHKMEFYNKFNQENDDTKKKKKQKISRKILMQEGKFQYTDGMSLRDLINMAGIQSAFDKKRIKIIAYDNESDRKKVTLVDFSQNPDFKLHPFDTVILFDYFETKPTVKATISGEVVKPGEYPIAQGMTLKEFIDSAGGLSERAYPKECEIIRYITRDGERTKKIINVALKKSSDFLIQPYDIVHIKRMPYWNDEKRVVIKGEVKFPGTYIIHSGEKLSSVIERAGGFTSEAFLYGAVFTRKEVAKLQQKSLERSLAKLKEQVVLASLQSAGSRSMGKISIADSIAAVESLIYDAEQITPIGRISVNLSSNIELFRNCPSDLTLKDGDTLTVPSHNDTVVVSGEVMNPMALAYIGDNVKDYIAKCGGLTEVSDTDHIFVLHANGEAEKASVGSYLFSTDNVYVKRGDVIIIPKKLVFERGIDIFGDIADIIYKLTLTVAAMHTVGAI